MINSRSSIMLKNGTQMSQQEVVAMASEAQAHQQEIIELDQQMERIMKIKKEVESQLIDERKSIFAVEK